MLLKNNPPKECLDILAALQSHGHEAYLVGGCVRDAILGRAPNDWDIATSALPEQVKAIFQKTFDTGLQHGTVSVLGADSNVYEVTTFRTDGQYTDGRHPESVEFVCSVEEDLSRRDFTINAIAWNEQKGFVDPFDGIVDIDKKTIRTVGDATQRFTEDGLRILRALRFSAELEFEIEQSTLDAIVELSHLLKKISVERKRDELCKILLSPHPEHINILQETNCLEYISTDIAATFPNRLKMIDFKECGIILDQFPNFNILLFRLSDLLTSLSVHSSKAKKILSALRFSNKETAMTCNIIEHHNNCLPTNETEMRLWCSKLTPEIAPYVIALKKQTETNDKIRDTLQLYLDTMSKKPCIHINDLDITGTDLQELGYYGKDIAKAKALLLDFVLIHPDKNTKTELIKQAKKISGF